MIQWELKAGVRLHGVRPETLFSLHVASGVWESYGLTTFTITGGIEGQHTDASAHYRGCAVDVRTKTLPAGKAREAIVKLQALLGDDFYILLENLGEANEHVHIEFRPKAAY